MELSACVAVRDDSSAAGTMGTVLREPQVGCSANHAKSV